MLIKDKGGQLPSALFLAMSESEFPIKLELSDDSDRQLPQPQKPKAARKRQHKTATGIHDQADDITNVKSEYSPAPKRKRKNKTTAKSSNDSSPENDTTHKRTRAPSTSRKWTGAELVSLLDAAVGKGVPSSVFEEVVHRRTKHQCDCQWW